MDYAIQNDINRITKFIQMMENVNKFQFETDVGKEFGETIKQSLNDIIKPRGREIIIELKNTNQQ